MKPENVFAIGRRSIFVALTLSALVAGCSATLATADSETTRPNASASAAPPAVPGIPDVGQPGEGNVPQTKPTIIPQGNPVLSIESGPAERGSTQDGEWTAVIGIADGARIRTQPVTGTVVGLIPYHAYYWIYCKTRASDGTVWGYATHQGRYGWVRSDLWEIVRFTAPTAPPTRPIPWC
jgi:hypothetical protein